MTKDNRPNQTTIDACNEARAMNKARALSRGAVLALPFAMKELGKSLKRCRTMVGLRKEQWAKVLNVSLALVEGAENGTFRVSTKYVKRVVEVSDILVKHIEKEANKIEI